MKSHGTFFQFTLKRVMPAAGKGEMSPARSGGVPRQVWGCPPTSRGMSTFDRQKEFLNSDFPEKLSLITFTSLHHFRNHNK